MSKKVSINFSDRQLEMIEAIKAKDGVTTISGAIYIALAAYHKKVDKEGVFAGKTPAERAIAKVELKQAVTKATLDKKHREKKNICENILGGTVFKDESGGFSCKFNNYFASEPNEPQILPLDLVNEGYAENQFFPSREAVFKKKPELKKKFAGK